MAKFYFDASDLPKEEVEKIIKDSQCVANQYQCTIKIATATKEVICHPQYSSINSRTYKF